VEAQQSKALFCSRRREVERDKSDELGLESFTVTAPAVIVSAREVDGTLLKASGVITSYICRS
jgi:hypothetical protein